MPDTISPQEASALLAEGKATFLDVRRKADKAADPEMIPGAVWHDPEKVDEWKRTIPSEAQVVIYCMRGGSVSKGTLAALHDAGLNASFIEGGIEAWRKTRQG